MIDEKGLPTDHDAERLSLGAVLRDSNRFAEIAAVVGPDDYSLEKHRRIFTRMGEIAERGEQINRVTLANELRKHNQLKACDGLSYLVSLDDGLSEVFSVDSALRVLKEKSVQRRAIIACYATADKIASGGPDSLEQIATAERVLRDLSAEALERRKLRTAGEIIAGLPGGLEGFMNPPPGGAGVPFPWARSTNGLRAAASCRGSCGRWLRVPAAVRRRRPVK